MVSSLTSVAGVTALLEEQDPKLQAYALQKLNSLVDQFWAELADSVARIEELYEDESFPERQLAALVASKVYFYLGEMEDALSFALGAEALFDVEQRTEYVETVVSKAIDQYIEQRSASPSDGSTGKGDTSARLAAIVDKMVQRCMTGKEYRQVLGIALEARRLDIIQQVFDSTQDRALLVYVLEMVMSVVHARDVRRQVLELLVQLFPSLSEPDYFSTAQCYVYLNEPKRVSELLRSLLDKATSDERSLLIAYQTAFDLVEGATQEFLHHVQTDLQATAGNIANAEQVVRILQGEESIRLFRAFLHRANHADLAILKSTKDALDAHYSAYHSAVSLSNAFMHAGTGSDQFLRENLEWLAKASNWSKFTATAALGVLHRGSLQESISILQPYLPPEGGAASTSIYSEGGSLFALGLIHANHGAPILDLLTKTLRSNNAEVVQHGAALGLGAAGMATENEEVYEELRNVLYTDSAVSGEAAGYAMGMVYLGTGSAQATEEMMQYAQETQHEKILRGLAIGIALLHYGRESAADATIDELLSHKDAILRYGGVYTMALAYAGTGHNAAVRRLLHVAVSDGSDDVRRASVIALGFLLFRSPEHMPEMVQLLSESYNPHLRYGAALALGIACAGTGLDAALDLLEPLTKDTVDFVRQGACIAMAMILVQQNNVLNPRGEAARTTFDKMIHEKHEEAMAKFGAALAQGLIDAGGRNVTISLQGRGGSTNMAAVVGMALFTQYWYWFPMAHFASLALTPTAILGVTKSLELPAWDILSHARPSLFAYPPPVQTQTEKKLEKVETAVLSTTAKAQARQRTKAKQKAQAASAGEADMDVDAPKPTGEKATTDEANAAEASDKESAKAAAPSHADEPKEERIPNGSRVTVFQLKYLSCPAEARYVPVRPWTTSSSSQAAPEPAAARQLDLSVTGGRGGIVLLLDREPTAPFVPAVPDDSANDASATATAEEHAQAAATLASTSDDADAPAEATGVASSASAQEPEDAPKPVADEDVDMDEQAK